MFADDTKIRARIQKLEDKDSLQHNLDKLVEWSKQWLLAFNPEKCKVMHTGHDQPTKYTMNTEGKGIQLEDITKEKDLGIWITRDLKPREQCSAYSRQRNTARRYNYREGSWNLDH